MVIGVVSDPLRATVVVDERVPEENQENGKPNIFPVYAVDMVELTNEDDGLREREGNHSLKRNSS